MCFDWLHNFLADSPPLLLSSSPALLFSGDVSNLAPEDKRDWLETILRQEDGFGNSSSSSSSSSNNNNNNYANLGYLNDPDSGTAFAGTAAGTGIIGQAGHGLGLGLGPGLGMGLGSSSAPSFNPLATLVGPGGSVPAVPLGERSWREALLYLRTMFPGGGNYSGVGVELDDAETAIYWRITEMREKLAENTRRGATKLALAAESRERERARVEQQRKHGLEREADADVDVDAEPLVLHADVFDGTLDGLGGGGSGGGGGMVVETSISPVNIYASKLLDEADESEERGGEAGSEEWA